MTNSAETQFGSEICVTAINGDGAFRAPLALSWLRIERADYKVRDLPFACPIPALHPLPESAILHSVRGHSILSLWGEMYAALLPPHLSTLSPFSFQVIHSLGYQATQK